MKKIQLLTSIILTLLMIIAPQSIALAADDSSQASAVSLISDGFSVDKRRFMQEIHLNLNIQ